jgi:3-hydroxyacyl-[acyl-carrier-protein] dehydratase
MNARSAWLRIPGDHPALAGHFPGRPIVPGALLLDETLRALEEGAGGEPPAAGSHWHIASLKFHRAVQPGETLRLDCSAQPGGSWRVELHEAGSLVMSASLERRPP